LYGRAKRGSQVEAIRGKEKLASRKSQQTYWQFCRRGGAGLQRKAGRRRRSEKKGPPMKTSWLGGKEAIKPGKRANPVSTSKFSGGGENAALITQENGSMSRVGGASKLHKPKQTRGKRRELPVYCS